MSLSAYRPCDEILSSSPSSSTISGEGKDIGQEGGGSPRGAAMLELRRGDPGGGVSGRPRAHVKLRTSVKRAQVHVSQRRAAGRSHATLRGPDMGRGSRGSAGASGVVSSARKHPSAGKGRKHKERR